MHHSTDVLCLVLSSLCSLPAYNYAEHLESLKMPSCLCTLLTSVVAAIVPSCLCAQCRPVCWTSLHPVDFN